MYDILVVLTHGRASLVLIIPVVRRPGYRLGFAQERSGTICFVKEHPFG